MALAHTIRPFFLATAIACTLLLFVSAQGVDSQVVIPKELERLASPLSADSSLLTESFKEGSLCSQSTTNATRIYCHSQFSNPGRKLTVNAAVCIGEAFDYDYKNETCAKGSLAMQQAKFSTTFFTVSSMKEGNSMELPNTTTSDMGGAKFLPDGVASAMIMPLTTHNYSYFLSMFGVSNGTDLEHFINHTIAQCSTPSRFEVHACPISIEQMIKFVNKTVGPNFTVLTPPALPKARARIIDAQLLNSRGQKLVSCHEMKFPTLVFKCHQTKDSMLFDVSLKEIAPNSSKVLHGLVICHVDTSYWNPSHVSFRVLHTKPGKSPICHWLPPSTIVFLGSEKTT